MTPMIMSSFVFGPEPTLPGAFYARVPTGIKGKQALFDVLRADLRFPAYCGNNWDAVEECIRDLSWLPSGVIVVVHNDLPLRDNPAALRTYLSILSGAASKWEGTRDRRLLVVFPADVEQLVKNDLAASGDS
jgi:hypothetical protein